MAKYWKWNIITSVAMVALTLCADTNNTNSSIEDALNFVNKLLNELNTTRVSNVILVIGNTGSGKSTLTHYLTGDSSKMFSIKPSNPNLPNYEIRDELDPDRDRITYATESRTLIPQMYTDENQIVWCDTPGFGDTRNKTVEIATMLSIKSVIENAANIKIVLVVAYDSVSQSNRDDFDNLLSRSTELMQNIDHFRNSVSLIVSKAPPSYVIGRNIIDMLEENVKNSTVQFINEHRSFLNKKGLNDNKIKNKIQLIDALLANQSNDCPKISVFWRPDDVGPFDQLPRMINGRRLIRESILTHNAYSDVNLTDFGFPLTPEAQNTVRDMVDHIIDALSTIPRKIIYKLLIEIQKQIESSDTIKRRLEIINIGMNCIQINDNNSSFNLTLSLFFERIQQFINAYNLTSSIDTSKLTQIEQNEKNLNFLNSLITTQHIERIDYGSFFEEIVRFLSDFNIATRNGIRKTSQEAIKTISTILAHVDKQLLTSVRSKLESIVGFQYKLEQLELAKSLVQSKTFDENQIATLKQRMEQIKNLTQAFDVNQRVSISELNRIYPLENTLNTIKSIAGNEFELPVRDWIAMSSKAINYQNSMYDWYSFLNKSYQYFGDYDRQKNKQEIPTIDENNFKKFTQEVQWNADYIPTESKIKEFNEIVNMTMSPPTIQCDGELMTIKGTFVKSSGIQNACPSMNAITIIKVYVLDTFYVDGNLYLNKTKEVELQIIAKIWDIRVPATFHLNGINGEPHAAPTEKSGVPGKCGNPGTNAGNFIGYANEIINGNRLSIDLNGGHGGHGQDGAASPDVYVRFDRDTHTGEGPHDSRTTSPDKYYLRYFDEEGYPDRDLIYSRSYFTGFISSTIYHTFVLYPYGKRCCSASRTGGGGIGKIL